jgi:hypothetical protein
MPVLSPTSITDTVKDLRPNDPVAVAVEDLQPKAKYVQMTLAAAEDIRFCEKLFDGWMTELNKYVANRFSQPRVPSYENNGFTDSRAAPRSQGSWRVSILGA